MGGWHCIVLRRVDKGDQGMADSSAAVLPFHLHIYIILYTVIRKRKMIFGRLELFRKFIRFGGGRHPLEGRSFVGSLYQLCHAHD